jgi:hypothetical protein
VSGGNKIKANSALLSQPGALAELGNYMLIMKLMVFFSVNLNKSTFNVHARGTIPIFHLGMASIF